MKTPLDNKEEISQVYTSENHRIIAAHLTAANKYLEEPIILENGVAAIDDLAYTEEEKIGNTIDDQMKWKLPI